MDMVFHPDFAKNKKVIISYVNKEPLEDRVSSFTLTEKGIDLKSEIIHLKVKQPHGQIYNTISNGKANMKGYAAQIPEADRR